MDELIRSAHILEEFHVLPLGPSAAAESIGPFLARATGAGLDETPSVAAEAGSPAAAGDRVSADAAALAMLQEELGAMRTDLAVARERAETEGYGAGYERGLSEAQRVHGELLERLRGMIESLRSSMDEQVSGIEDLAVDITFQAACKVIGAAAVDRVGVISVVREVIAKAKEREKMVIRVAPTDLSLLSDGKSELLGGMGGIEVNLVADDRIAMGGCLVETGTGSLDGRLDLQLQLLRDTLLGARRALPE